jgi:hypothetical protein
MWRMNNARGRLAREGPRPTPGDQSIDKLTKARNSFLLTLLYRVKTLMGLGPLAAIF